MLFKNANIENGAVRASECSTQETADCKAEEGLLDMRVKNGKFAEIGANLTPEDEEKIIDLRGKLVLPPFIESHGSPRYLPHGRRAEVEYVGHAV